MEEAISNIEEFAANGHEQGNVGKMDQVYSRLLEKHPDLEFDSKIYNIRIKGYMNGQLFDQAIKLVAEMKEKGIARGSSTYVPVIGGLCRAEAADKLLQFFGDNKDEITGDVRMYNEVIFLFFKRNQTNAALQVYEGMRKKKIQPTNVTANIVINNLFKARRPQEAYNYFLAFRKEEGAIDGQTYNFMIKGLFIAKKYDEVLGLIPMLKEDGLSISPKMHAMIVDVYVFKNNIENAKGILRKILKMNHLQVIEFQYQYRRFSGSRSYQDVGFFGQKRSRRFGSYCSACECETVCDGWSSAVLPQKVL